MDPKDIGKLNEDGSEHKIYSVCLTGGPCAGKTSSMKFLKEKFEPEFIVYTLPEVAATTVGSGVTIIPSEFTPATHEVFTVSKQSQYRVLTDLGRYHENANGS